MSNVNFQATATDNVTTNVSITYSKAPGSVFPLGETIVTATATDQASNTATCTFKVIHDLTNPTITCPSDIYTALTNVNFQATATDNVTTNVSITYSKAPGSVFPLGETIVTATATDQASNTATCTFKVIHDQSNPSITCPNDIITTLPTINFRAIASDNLTKNVPITYSQAPGSVFPLGETIVTATATDQASNTAICTFKVIRDLTKPLIICPADIFTA